MEPPLKLTGGVSWRQSSKSSAVAEMGDRLAAIDMGRKVGGAVPPSVGDIGPHLTQCHLGRGLPPDQVAF